MEYIYFWQWQAHNIAVTLSMQRAFSRSIVCASFQTRPSLDRSFLALSCVYLYLLSLAFTKGPSLEPQR